MPFQDIYNNPPGPGDLTPEELSFLEATKGPAQSEPVMGLTAGDTPDWVSLANTTAPVIESTDDHPWGVDPSITQQAPELPVAAAGPVTQPPSAQPTPQEPSPAEPQDPNAVRSAELDKAFSTTKSVASIKNSRQGIGRQEQLSNIHAASVLEHKDLVRQADARVATAKSEVDRQTAEATTSALDAYDQDRQLARTKASNGVRESQARVDALARAEPNPGRLWSNMSGWNKAAFLLGNIAFALSTNRTNPGAASPLMQQFMRQVEEDVASQKESTERLISNEKSKQASVIAQKADDLDAAKEKHEGVITRIAAADKYLQGIAAQAGNNERRLAGVAEARATLAAAAADVNARWLGTLTSREDKAADRAHAERMAQIQFDNQVKLKQLDQQAEKEKNNRQVSPELGLSIITGRDAKGNPIMKTMDAVDEKGNPIKKPMTVLEKDVLPKATEMVATAQRVHDAMGRAIRKLETMTNKDVLLNEDPEFNQDMQLVGRYLATDKTFNEGRTSDADVRSGDKTAAGLGQGGLASSLANLLDRRDMTLAALQHYRSGLTSVVNKSLQQFPTPEGGSLHWTPIQNEATPADTSKYSVPGEEEQKLAQSEDALAGIPSTRDPSVPALEAAGFRNPEPVSRYTPVTRLAPVSPEEAASLETAAQAAKGATPAAIRETINNAGSLDGKPVSEDARNRFFRTQDAMLEDAQKREQRAANELINYLKEDATKKDGKLILPDPSNREIREYLLAGGFSPGKIRPEDYDNMRAIVEETWKKQQSSLGGSITYTPEDAARFSRLK